MHTHVLQYWWRESGHWADRNVRESASRCDQACWLWSPTGQHNNPLREASSTLLKLPAPASPATKPERNGSHLAGLRRTEQGKSCIKLCTVPGIQWALSEGQPSLKLCQLVLFCLLEHSRKTELLYLFPNCFSLTLLILYPSYMRIFPSSFQALSLMITCVYE